MTWVGCGLVGEEIIFHTVSDGRVDARLLVVGGPLKRDREVI